MPFALAGGYFPERADGLPLQNNCLLAVCVPFYGGLITFCLLITFLLLDMISIYSRTRKGRESSSEQNKKSIESITFLWTEMTMNCPKNGMLITALVYAKKHNKSNGGS